MNDSLETLLADGIIDAVIGQLKTGKEAEVWLVQHAGQVVAAKLYKERHERNFRNNSGYKEGREVRNSRTRRAMEKGSRFGQAAAEEAWKNAEADSLYKLHAQGVRVPTPVLFYEGILLMELVLDEQGQPAPRLVEAPPLTPEEAEAVYLDLRGQVIRTLCADLIHGDLSPYNILMSGNGPTLIDFPQTVAAARNSQAEFYFRRDLDNVREFLTGISPRLESRSGDTGEIWNAYVRRDLTPEFSPSGTFREPPRRQGAQGRPGGRAERFGQEGRGDLRAAPAPVAAVALEEGVSAEEAELRALEALVLRQGGGERGRPVVTSSPRDGRRRGGFGGKPPPRTGSAPRPGNAGPQQGAAARPQQGGGARPGGNNGRPQQGGPRAGNGAPVAQGANVAGDARTNGRPPQGGGPRNGNPQQRAPNEPRRDGRPPRQPNGDARVNGPSQPQNGSARMNGAPSGGEPRMNGAPSGGEPRMNGRPPRGEPRANGRPPQGGEPRMDGAQQNGNARMNGRPQQGGEPRTDGVQQNGRSQQGRGARTDEQPAQHGEPRMNGRSQQNGGARTEGQPAQHGAPRTHDRSSENGSRTEGPPARQHGESRANGRQQNTGFAQEPLPQQDSEPRRNNRSQPRNGEPRMNGRSSQNGDSGTNGPQQNAEPRMNGRASQQNSEPRMSNRTPQHGDSGNGGPPQHGEPRTNGRSQQNGESRANGPQQNGEPRTNNRAPQQHAESSSNASPQGEPRTNGRPPRGQRTPNAEAGDASFAPPKNGAPGGDNRRQRAQDTEPQNGRGAQSAPHEARDNAPRMPRQAPERGAGRPSRGGSPQVSYVGRSPASASSNRGPETGS
ncbi:RIO1 family regulatory kinase/ATPase domain-containing protein [Corallococcus sicarius]|uniref:non-specific serine/threonine protein kinase n=1 Tax=Corallococcus sicarius TaxID=2316726 RepID=A0A3A8N0I2_9BACT|nr:RIO1 family regulatory kinase/ATPase [Corallococcus sicarius]RKH37080.1 hypothetical protein D7X12_30830 [Corallococcus sicarius]